MPPADRLAARALELIDVPSESRNENDLATLVLEVLGDAGARDAGDTCVLAGTTTRGARPLVLLAGHLDTVPAQENRPGRRDDGAVHGLGAADMKGAVAVMVELALSGLGERANIDFGYVFFGREELPVIHSALTPLLQREPGLRSADAVIVMEPTANAIHAGCLGNINATWTFPGTSGHSARPWLADNAIHRAAAGIDALAQVPAEPREFDGLRFVQVVSVTRIEGGIAGNVIPDRATAHVNFRYAPGTSAEEAEALLRSWCEPYGAVTIDSNAPSAPVATQNDLVQRLIAAGDLEVEPKQAWTPVAEFAAAGVDAVNFGPGDPRYAHTRDEQVAVDALVRSYETLERFACG
jgi:succinyl-diaminopimelate desuccinylase